MGSVNPAVLRGNKIHSGNSSSRSLRSLLASLAGREASRFENGASSTYKVKFERVVV